MTQMHKRLEPKEKSIESVMAIDKTRKDIDCPMCHGHDWESLEHIRVFHDVKLVICKKCGFVTYNPQLPNMMRWYMDEVRAQNVAFLQSKVTKTLYQDKLLFKFLDDNKIKPKSFLDYGCSDGYMMQLVKEYTPDCRLKGIEINKGHRNWAKYIQGLDVSLDHDLDNLDEMYEWISIYHVLEHVQEVDKFMQKVANRLKPGGYIYMACPTMDRLFNYPTKESFFRDEHVNIWTKDNLREFIESYGFKQVFFDNSLYGTCMIFNHTGKKKEQPSFYNENRSLIERLNGAFDLRAQIKKDVNNFEKSKLLGLQGLSLYDEYPYLIRETASYNDEQDHAEFLEEYITKKPHMPELIVYLALLYYNVTDFKKAKELLKKGMVLIGRQPDMLIKMGEIAYLENDHENMVLYMKEAMEKSPYNMGFFNATANLVAKI